MTTLSPAPPVLAGAAAMQAAAAVAAVPPAGTGPATVDTGSGSLFSAVLSGLDVDSAPAESLTSSASALPVQEPVPALFAVTDNTRQGVQLPGMPALAHPQGGESLPLDGRPLPSADDEELPGRPAEQYTDPGTILPARLIENSAGPLPAAGPPSPPGTSPITAEGSAMVASAPVSNTPAAQPTVAIEAGIESGFAAAAAAAGHQATAPAREPGAAFDPATRQTGSPGGDAFPIDAPLPVEAQSRLHTMMAALDRALPGPDPLTTPLPAAPAGSTAAAAVGATPVGAVPPGFTDLPALEPGADQQAWTRGLGERLLLMAEKGQQSATLRLQPEQLGPMQIHIRIDEDGASQVLFSAHHAQTRDAIEQALPRLRELFAEQGLNLAQADVDSGRRAFDGRDFTGMRDGEPADSGTAVETGASQGATVWQLRPPSSRRLDLLI